MTLVMDRVLEIRVFEFWKTPLDGVNSRFSPKFFRYLMIFESTYSVTVLGTIEQHINLEKIW